MAFLEGADFSEAQGVVKWHLAAQKIKFALIRAQEGLYHDKQFDANWYNAHFYGLPCSAYHAIAWKVDPINQADWFAHYTFPYKGEVWPAVDVEWGNDPTPAHAADITYAVLTRIEADLGITPMIYSSLRYWSAPGMDDPKFARFHLWIAQWGVNAPGPLPKPFTHWDFWQYGVFADAADYGASSSRLDHDRFNGSQEDFNKTFGIKTPKTLEERVGVLESQAKLHGWEI